MQIKKPEGFEIELNLQIKQHLETLSTEQIRLFETIVTTFQDELKAQRIEIEIQNKVLIQAKADLANANLRQLECSLRLITERKKNL
jgi:hypothetical protein